MKLFKYVNYRANVHSLTYKIIYFAIALVFFCFLLITTLSNPGIVFRGQPADSKKPLLSQCRKLEVSHSKHYVIGICEVSRPAKACHCERCNTCCYEVGN